MCQPRRYFDLEVTKLGQKGLKLSDERRKQIAEQCDREAWATEIADLWHAC